MKGGLLTGAAILAGFVMTAQIPAQVRINEFLANNVSVNPDNWDFEDFSDWIELYNAGSAEADIGGYYLTGDIKQPKKWQIPTGTTIPAGGYLLVWADDHDGKPGQQETREWYPWNEKYTLKGYHAVFKLAKDGEQVGLFKADGSIADSVTFPKQYSDVSMGRKADGSWAFFDEPTPGAANSTAAKPLTVFQTSGDVAFSVEGGMYASAQTVTLTAADGSDIYYTTDGSIPYASDKKYSSPVSVSKTTIIRARTISADKFAGKVITNTYFIGEKARTVMVVSMSTDPAFLNDKTVGIWANNMKGREIPVAMEFFTTDGKRAVRCNAGMRNGTLTSFMEKQHPMQIALRKRYGDETVNYRFYNKTITKFDRFRLRQGGDVWASNFIGDAVLDPINEGQTDLGYESFRPTVVFVNGEYYGLMNLREQFKDLFFAENYGVDGSKRDDVRSILQPGSSGGMVSSYKEGWEILAGTWTDYRSLISSVKTGTVDAAKYQQIQQQVDISSMADFFSIIHFGDGVSWGHNQELWKVPGGKWRWLVTDFDRGWTYGGTGSLGGVTHNLFTSGAGSSPALIPGDTLLNALLKNSEFKNYFVQRYAAHLNSTFTPDRLTKIVDSIAGLITDEMTDHAAKWGPQGGIASLSAWKSDVGSMRKFMEERAGNIWKYLETSPVGMSGGTAALTVKLSPANANADIFVNGVRMCQGTTGLTFFKTAPIVVKAVGKPGWQCSGWDSGEKTDSVTITLTGDKTVTASFNAVSVIDAKPLMNRSEHAGVGMHARGNRFVLRVPAGFGHVSAVFFDISGKKIETMSMAGKTGEITSSRKYAAGVYYYRITTDNVLKTGVVTLQ